jgi:tRNA pseudouridine38-40 synthase
VTELANYRILVAYIGTAYKGWQIQPSSPTIQRVIEDLLFKIFKQRIVLVYSSRTDAGVHALGQVANFVCEPKYDEKVMLLMLNTQLPEDIVVKSIEKVRMEFSSRHSKSKTYYYRIHNSKIKDPFKLNRVWWIPQKLNRSDMLEALELFKGKKDFNAFMSSGGGAKTTIREIYEVRLIEQDDEIWIYFTANGFLKQMVRNIVGTVVDVGKGRYKTSEVSQMLASCDRTKAGVTAPARGLYLEKVVYDE